MDDIQRFKYLNNLLCGDAKMLNHSELPDKAFGYIEARNLIGEKYTILVRQHIMANRILSNKFISSR